MQVTGTKPLVITSKVARANSKSPSVRTTIPEEIVAELKIEVGDPLVWRIDQRDGKKGVFIRKAE
jgi:hypothetical protein